VASTNDLVAAVYDAAAIDPSCSDAVVERLVVTTKSSSGTLVLRQAGAGQFGALDDVDPVLAEAYPRPYHRRARSRRPNGASRPGARARRRPYPDRVVRGVGQLRRVRPSPRPGRSGKWELLRPWRPMYSGRL